MGICIDKLPHKSCGGSQSLQVFLNEETNKIDGFCFKCGTYVRHPYGEEVSIDQVRDMIPPPKTPEEIQKEIEEVEDYQTVTVRKRKLRQRDLELFNIKVALSEEDGETPSSMYFPITKEGEITGYYVKTLSDPPINFSIGDVRGGDPFGWEQAKSSGAYRLYIVEGLIDAPSLLKIHKMYDTDGEWEPAVISLTNGTNSVKGLASKANDIEKLFKEVVICFDNDEAGNKATNEALKILPNALVVNLPAKDANDCLLEGKTKEAFKQMSYKAVKKKNTRLVSTKDLHLLAREPTPMGELTWPFQTMNTLLRNIRLGETIYIGAGVKMGKSELLNELAAHFITVDGVKVFMAKPEEQIKKSYKMLLNKVVGYKFTDPNVEFDYNLYDKAGDKIDDMCWFLDLYQHIGWESLKSDIIEAVSMGAKVVMIDPITNLTSNMNSADANTFLHKFAAEISAMALDLNFTAFIFCHLKAPEGNISKDQRLKKYENNQYYNLGNCPHEYGGDILSNQFYGSRAMMQKCNLMLGLAGNKDPELEEHVGRIRWITINEDREFGNNQHIPIIWNPNTTKYKEL